MIKKHDFVELKFTGRVKDGEIFDTNIPEDAKKINLKLEEVPLIVCVGQEMLISGFDKELEGKELNKEYQIELEQDKAFGSRKKELIKLIPTRLFLEKNIRPVPGMTLALDNNLVKIVNVSGGRVLADFNNPLAGKTIQYEFTITRKVEDNQEKVTAIINFFLKGQKIDFEIKDKTIIFKALEFYKPLFDELNKRFKDILGLTMTLNPVKQDKKQ